MKLTSYHQSFVKVIASLVGWLVIKTAKQGAQTTIHLAVSEDVQGVTGSYRAS